MLGFSRSKAYYRSQKATSDLITYEQLLGVLQSNPSYGHRRLALALGLGKKRVRRVMKLFGLKPYKRQARWRKRRDEQRAPMPYPNLVKGLCPRVANYVWVCDFTYLDFQDRFLYLATVVDLFTREVLGWHVSTRHTKDLVIEALQDALITRCLVRPRIIHSDQGVEYASKDYIQFATNWGIEISMSKKASPWENPYQESYFNNFKTDLGLEFSRFDTVGEFIEAIHQTINYYNKHRIHTSLKMSPSNFYQQQIRIEKLS